MRALHFVRKRLQVLNIEFRISDEQANSLTELARRCTEANARNAGATSHGELGLSDLLALLVEDAAMVIDRPGSWEGASMAQLLAKHGYEI